MDRNSDEFLIASLAAQSQGYIKQLVGHKDEGTLNPHESRADWRRIVGQTNGQLPPSQPPVNFPPQYNPNTGYGQPPQQRFEDYPNIPTEVPGAINLLPMPTVNGRPVIPPELQFQPTQGQQYPQPTATPFDGLSIGGFQMPDYSGKLKEKEEQFDKIMTEIKLLRKEVRKLQKVITDSIVKSETVTPEPSPTQE